MLRAAPILTVTAQWLVILSPLLILAGRAPTDIGLSLVALFFLAHSAITRDSAWLRERWVQLSLALCVFMCARHLLLADGLKGLGYGLVWIRFPIFAAALAYWILPDAAVRRKLIYFLTGALAFLMLDGLWQYLTGTDIFGREWVQYPSNVRLTGPFSSPRLGISIAWIFLPAAIYWLNATAAQLKSFRFLAAAAFYCGLLTVIFVSGERMAFIFAVFGSILAFLIITHLRTAFMLTGLLGMVLLSLFASYDSSLIIRQLGQTDAEVERFADGAYGKSFAEAWQIALNHPVLGVGVKHYQHACEQEIKTVDATAFCGMHPHNFYLDWLAHYGFTGTALMLAIIACFFAKAFRHWSLVRSDAVLGALFVMLMIRFWPIASVTSQFTVWSGHPQWLIIGWFLAMLAAARKA